MNSRTQPEHGCREAAPLPPLGHRRLDSCTHVVRAVAIGLTGGRGHAALPSGRGVGSARPAHAGSRSIPAPVQTSPIRTPARGHDHCSFRSNSEGPDGPATSHDSGGCRANNAGHDPTPAIPHPTPYPAFPMGCQCLGDRKRWRKHVPARWATGRVTGRRKADLCRVKAGRFGREVGGTIGGTRPGSGGGRGVAADATSGAIDRGTTFRSGRKSRWTNRHDRWRHRPDADRCRLQP